MITTGYYVKEQYIQLWNISDQNKEKMNSGINREGFIISLGQRNNPTIIVLTRQDYDNNYDGDKLLMKIYYCGEVYRMEHCE